MHEQHWTTLLSIDADERRACDLKKVSLNTHQLFVRLKALRQGLKSSQQACDLPNVLIVCFHFTTTERCQFLVVDATHHDLQFVILATAVCIITDRAAGFGI